MVLSQFMLTNDQAQPTAEHYQMNRINNGSEPVLNQPANGKPFSLRASVDHKFTPENTKISFNTFDSINT